MPSRSSSSRPSPLVQDDPLLHDALSIPSGQRSRSSHILSDSDHGSDHGSRDHRQGHSETSGQASILSWLDRPRSGLVTPCPLSPINPALLSPSPLPSVPSQGRPAIPYPPLLSPSPLPSVPSQGSGIGIGSDRGSHHSSRVSLPSRREAADYSKWGPAVRLGEEAPPLAVRLARQLWQFQGCTKEEHQQAREQHDHDCQENCHSLPEITALIQGRHDVTQPQAQVPDVLGQSTHLMKRNDYSVHTVNAIDWPAVFEGTPSASATPFATPSPSASATEPTHPPTAVPWRLCLDAHHSSSPQHKPPLTSFDIDSLLVFPQSLAVARLGIDWLPQQYPTLNLRSSVHLGLEVSVYNAKGVEIQEWQPLHCIRHYCFGRVTGMPLSLFFFFPQYNFYRGITSGSGSGRGVQTLLMRQDEITWIDDILLPALFEVDTSPNARSHYPCSAETIKVNAEASGSERYMKGKHSSEQFLSYSLQPEILDALWEAITKRIASATRFKCFSRLTLFLDAKNTKLKYMDTNLLRAVQKWRRHWDLAVDPAFLSQGLTIIDLGKQVSARLPSVDDDEDDDEAETYIYRKHCLDSFYTRWTATPPAPATATLGSEDLDLDPEASSSDEDLYSADSPPRAPRPRRPPPPATAAATPPSVAGKLTGFKKVSYPWATLRDAGSQTIATAHTCPTFKEGYIYSQFYNLIKGPFDAAKVYVFENENLENLALDPAYIRTLNKAGGAVAFSQATATASYLHGKKRASLNLRDRTRTSFGVREEHRISLELLDAVCDVWESWEAQPSLPLPPPAPLPFYTFRSKQVLQFLKAQINKHCFLFEYVLANTQTTHSLPEFTVMVLALRALRYSYSSTLIQRESLLFKDQWQVKRKGKDIQLEGIGMAVAMAQYGIGWFLPKINWTTWRVIPPHGDHFLAGNILLHRQYQRRWRAVRDLRDVYVRLGQAEEWFTRHHLRGCGRDQRQWLDFLHGLNINQFDLDISTSLLRSHKSYPELAPSESEYKVSSFTPFCYRTLRKTFQVDPDHGPLPPHTVLGNKGRFTSSSELIDFLFNWDKNPKQGSWAKLTYRLIFQRTCEIIQKYLGQERQRQWQREFKFLIQVTHWILPYANDQSFLNLTKSNKAKGLIPRTSWFSAVYNEHPLELKSIPDWPQGLERSLDRIIDRASSSLSPLPQPQLRPRPPPEAWEIIPLIKACRRQGLTFHRLNLYSCIGRTQDGTTIFPRWEKGTPPRLKVLEQIRDKTLDELEEVFVDMLNGAREAEAEEVARAVAEALAASNIEYASS
jgi:hypothetical protein